MTALKILNVGCYRPIAENETQRQSWHHSLLKLDSKTQAAAEQRAVLIAVLPQRGQTLKKQKLNCFGRHVRIYRRRYGSR